MKEKILLIVLCLFIAICIRTFCYAGPTSVAETSVPETRPTFQIACNDGVDMVESSDRKSYCCPIDDKIIFRGAILATDGNGIHFENWYGEEITLIGAHLLDQ